MRALRVENQNVSVAEVATPSADGEALVRVILSGICNTDLEIARGYAGFEGTIGHEFVGVIESVSGVSEARPEGPQPGSPLGVGRSARAVADTDILLTRGLLPGTRVVGEINAGCGVCELCR